MAGLRERLLTELAHVWTHAVMYPAMPPKHRRLTEGCVANFTSERPRSGVDADVRGDLARVAERFVADVARVRLLSGVDASVNGENGRTGKRFAADIAQTAATLNADAVH